eukprot:467545-Hanusia_phi.AAC.1
MRGMRCRRPVSLGRLQHPPVTGVRLGLSLRHDPGSPGPPAAPSAPSTGAPGRVRGAWSPGCESGTAGPADRGSR